MSSINMAQRQGRRPRRLRTRRAVVPFIAASLVLAGCGGNGDTASSGSSGEPADAKIELTVWAGRKYYIPPDEFKSFMAEHPNIVVKWDVKDNDDTIQQLQRMKDANQQLPDVVQDPSLMVEAYNNAGLIIPIDEQVERWKKEDPTSYDKILPSAWDETKIDGKLLGMSITANFDVLYYNSPWAKEAGVTPPINTFDDLFAAAQKLKAARPDKAALSVQALAGEGATAFINFMIGSGVPFKGATPDLKSPQGLYVLDWFKRAQSEGLLPKEALAWGEAESRGAFVSGDGGLMVDGFTTAGDFADVKGFDYPTSWSNTLLPEATGTGGFKGTRTASARTWMITSGSKHPYEASLLLRYIADTPQLVGQATHGGVPPRQTEALNDPALVKAWPFFTEEIKQAFINATPRPTAANTAEVVTVLEQLFGELVKGSDQSPQQLADKYQPQLDALNS
jgi:multiple sugar transport system substrate-binding protein